MHLKMFITRYVAIYGGQNWTYYGAERNWDLMTETTSFKHIKRLDDVYQRVFRSASTQQVDSEGDIADFFGNLPALSELFAKEASEIGIGDSASNVGKKITKLFDENGKEISMPRFPEGATANEIDHLIRSHIEHAMNEKFRKDFQPGFMLVSQDTA